jgi:hypothetical protein
MGFKDRVDPDLVKEVSSEYKKASAWLPFSALELQDVFKEEELKEVEELVRDMRAAANENKRRAELQAKIGKYAGVVLKLLGRREIALPSPTGDRFSVS